jgi:hypothetical protein
MQWPLEESYDLASQSLDQLREKRLLSALEQCFGYMFMEEAVVGCVGGVGQAVGGAQLRRGEGL